MKRTESLFCVLLFLPILTACLRSNNSDSHPEAEVIIGSQIWMSKNLNVSTFRNGDAIPIAITTEEWIKAGKEAKPAYCYYGNDTTHGSKYGKLYNWYAVNDSRGLAPEGWHVPSDSEWTILENHLGKDAGSRMKSNSGWNNNGNGDNLSGFTGMPGGYRNYYYGYYYSIGDCGYWWCSTMDSTSLPWLRSLNFANSLVLKGSLNKGNGFSVRCIKD